MTESVEAEGVAAWRLTVLEALAAKLACVVLVDWHEGVCELAVFEDAVHVSVESEEQEVAIFLRDWHIKVSQCHMQLGGVQVAFAALVQHTKRINQVEVFSQ